MKNGLSKKEKEFFLRMKDDESKSGSFIIVVFLLLLVGLVIDALNGFFVLRNTNSLLWGAVGLLALSLFYLFGGAVSQWITDKDDISQPLYIRAVRLLALLCFIGGLGALGWYIMKQLGWY